MKESDYYPAGAYRDPVAPYNEQLVPECDFDITVTTVLKRTETVTTDDYCPEYDDEDGHTYKNTENTDWNAVYQSQCYTISDLLGILKRYVEEDIKRYKGSKRKEDELNEILNACDGWTIEETDVYES